MDRLDYQEVILRNKHRDCMIEILTLCVNPKCQPLTRRLLQSKIHASKNKINELLFLLESLGFIKAQFAGLTILIRPTEKAIAFINERGLTHG